MDFTRKRRPLALLIFSRCEVLSKANRCLKPRQFMRAHGEVQQDADKRAIMAETLAHLQELQDAYASKPAQTQKAWCRVCEYVALHIRRMPDSEDSAISLPSLAQDTTH